MSPSPLNFVFSFLEIAGRPMRRLRICGAAAAGRGITVPAVAWANTRFRRLRTRFLCSVDGTSDEGVDSAVASAAGAGVVDGSIRGVVAAVGGGSGG